MINPRILAAARLLVTSRQSSSKKLTSHLKRLAKRIDTPKWTQRDEVVLTLVELCAQKGGLMCGTRPKILLLAPFFHLSILPSDVSTRTCTILCSSKKPQLTLKVLAQATSFVDKLEAHKITARFLLNAERKIAWFNPFTRRISLESTIERGAYYTHATKRR